MFKCVCVCVCALGVMSAPAIAGGNAGGNLVDLSFDALPSAQGYTYETVGNGNGIAETDIFSVDGSVLTSDTIGQPIGNTVGSNLYRNDLSGFGVSSGTMVLEIEARVLESETLLSASGFFASMQLAGRGMSIGLVDGTISFNTFNFAFDTSDWHTYTLVGDLDFGDLSVFVDGDLFFSGDLFATTGGDETRLGDNAGTANARVEVRRFEASSSEVPTPGVAALAALAGLGGLVSRRRS